MDIDTSVAVQMLSSAKALTSSFVATTNYVRVDSHSQLHFFIDYNPHTDNAASATCEMQVRIQYVANQPADYEAVSGGSNTFTWTTDTAEVDEGNGRTTFVVRTFAIAANATATADRDPHFARPMGVKVVRLVCAEANAGGKAGTYSAWVAPQRI